MHLIVCYDIVDDRRRGRLYRRMREYLPRVQKSVFEGEISLARLTEMRSMIQGQIDHNKDTVRIYHLCKACLPSTEVIGIGPLVEEDLSDIVL